MELMNPETKINNDKLMKDISDEFFSLNPKYRNKEKLTEIVSKLVKARLKDWLENEAEWTGGNQDDYGIENSCIEELIECF
jgi:hypothetical protein